MGKIFYLMGKSSSGKDTIYKKLIEDETLSLEKIVLYTTRPIRAGEQDGMEYHFVTEEVMQQMEKEGKIIELRTYDTCLGRWHYFTADDSKVNLETKSYIMIGTIESFLETREYYGKNAVVPLMISLDDGIRLQRALDREKVQSEPKYSEMCRRFLADETDFSTEKKNVAGIEREFVNEDLQKCLAEIRQYVEEQL
nr:guanylate kinase [Lachnospiraceae bacterium]